MEKAIECMWGPVLTAAACWDDAERSTAPADPPQHETVIEYYQRGSAPTVLLTPSGDAG